MEHQILRLSYIDVQLKRVERLPLQLRKITGPLTAAEDKFSQEMLPSFVLTPTKLSFSVVISVTAQFSIILAPDVRAPRANA